MPLLPSYFAVELAQSPLPALFMRALRELEVETAVGEASIVRLHFDVSRTLMGDFDVQAFDIFRPLAPLTVRISIGLGLPRTLINAFVRDARLNPSNTPGGSQLEVVALDALGSTMAHVQAPAVWPNSPDSDIATGIFGKYGMLSDTEATPSRRTENDTTSSQYDYDATYLFELAHRNSYELYIQPHPVLGRDVGHFHPPRLSATDQGVLSIDFGSQTNLTSFQVSNDMLAPTSVEAEVIDPRDRSQHQVSGRTSSEIPMGREPTLARIDRRPIERPVAIRAANPSEMYAQALARATQSSRAVTASGEVDGLKYNRPLLCGLPVLVRGPGSQHSGSYYVRSVTHRISSDRYDQSFSAWRNAVGLNGFEQFADRLAAIG